MALRTGVCLNLHFIWTICMGLLLLKKGFYAFFLTAMYFAFIAFVKYTTNKHLGWGVSTTSPPRPCVYLGHGVKSRK